MRFATCLWIIMICFGFMPAASAQTFEDGYQSYVRNQFPVAELQFKGALKKAKTDEDKAFIQKFIGICQYMRGDKKGANVSFTASVRLDQNVQIDEEEVLDPTVVPFFNSIKKVVNAQPRKVAAIPAPKAPAPKPAAPRKLPKPTGKGKGKALVSESSMGLPDDTLLADKTNSSSGGFRFLHLLPFGTGQFVNGSTILGAAFAGAEVGALYVFLDADKTIKEREGLNAVVANKEGLNDQQRQDFYSQNNAFIESVKSQKNLALVGFLALWAAGATEAILRAPGPAKKVSDYSLLPETHEGKNSWVLHWKTNF